MTFFLPSICTLERPLQKMADWENIEIFLYIKPENLELHITTFIFAIDISKHNS